MAVASGIQALLVCCDTVYDVLFHLFPSRSIDWEGTFEAKGVQNPQERLTRVHGDVREPFPDAVRAANVRLCNLAWLRAAVERTLQLP